MVLSLLKDLTPVVVFVDEIDQAIGRRDTGQNGDSGVSARMFARLLEELSNSENRGRILWIAATNRPDLLDDALLRRFDRVVPLLIPDLSEAQKIFYTMPKAISKQSRAQIAYGGDLAQQQSGGEPSERDLALFRPFAQRAVSMALTGAGVEIIVRRAIEYAVEDQRKPYIEARQGIPHDLPLPSIASHHLDQAIRDYKPNHDPDMYVLQSLYAIAACNFRSVLPTLPNFPPFSTIVDQPPSDGPGGPGGPGGGPVLQVNQQRLNQEIVALRDRLRERRVI
jgi:SpoVK/Ycf46/Vps4 family AAA+-type ATPase